MLMACGDSPPKAGAPSAQNPGYLGHLPAYGGEPSVLPLDDPRMEFVKSYRHMILSVRIPRP